MTSSPPATTAIPARVHRLGRHRSGSAMGGQFALVHVAQRFWRCGTVLRHSATPPSQRTLNGACPIVASFGRRDPIGSARPRACARWSRPRASRRHQDLPDVGHSFANKLPGQPLLRITDSATTRPPPRTPTEGLRLLQRRVVPDVNRRRHLDRAVHLVDAAAEDRLRYPPPRVPPVALGDLVEDPPGLGLGQIARDRLDRLTLGLAERARTSGWSPAGCC